MIDGNSMRNCNSGSGCNKNHTLHMNKEFLGLDDCIIRKTINAGTSIIVGKNEKLLYKILHRKQIYFLYG
mgnify:CR=1 FL=1